MVERPSYTSKEDQMGHIKSHLSQMRASKSMMRETLKEIDRLLDESKNGDDLDEVEKFYRSKKFIGSALNISRLQTPAASSSRVTTTAQYIHEINSLRAKNNEKLVRYPHGNALFAYFSPAAAKTKNNKDKIAKTIAASKATSPLVICQLKI